MLGKALSDLMIKPGKSPVFDKPENYNLDYARYDRQLNKIKKHST